MDANWWNNALQSYDVGRAHRADRENAEAFDQGGYDAVEQTAGRRGDLQTATSVRRFQDQRQQQAYEWFQQNAPYARNVIRRARAIQDPQQRQAFLASQRQRFEGMGFTPEQIDGAIAGLSGPEAEQWFGNLDSAFSQHENPDWQLNEGTGQIYAVDPETGQPQMGGQIDTPQEWRPLSPEEAASYELPPGVVAQINRQGQVRTIVGRPPAGGGADYQTPQLPSGFMWE